MADLLTTQQAADELGISRGRVIQLITAGRLPARQMGAKNAVYLIDGKDLAKVRDRKPGRPGWQTKQAVKRPAKTRKTK